jgi:REP-associated tyrosine transposase
MVAREGGPQECGWRSTHREQHKGSMMTQRGFDPKTYTRRNSNRLPSYDYRSSGAYFITLCTEKRQRVLEIPGIHTALLGHWQQLQERFPGVRVDAFVIMPDHVHGILWLDRSVKDAPTVGRVIGAFKAWVTIAWRNYHREAHIPCLSHLWQRDYYEHVIRNDDDLRLTREYILNNPLQGLLRQEQREEELKRARRKGEAGDHKGPPSIHPTTLAPTDAEAY